MEIERATPPPFYFCFLSHVQLVCAGLFRMNILYKKNILSPSCCLVFYSTRRTKLDLTCIYFENVLRWLYISCHKNRRFYTHKLLLLPFQIISRLTFFTPSLTICLIQKIVQNINSFFLLTSSIQVLQK